MTKSDGKRACPLDAVHAIRRRMVACVLFGVLVIAACGGGAKEAREKVNDAAETIPKTTNGASSGSGGTSSLPSPTTAPQEQTIELGLRTWYGGFAVGIEKATVETNSTGLSARTVRIALTLENLGADNSRINSQEVSLTSAGTSTLSGLIDLPLVPGKGKANGTLAFLVDEKFDVRSATLAFGPADSNQTIVSLAKGGQITAFEPKVLDVTATASTPNLRLDLKGGRLDASYVRGEKGKLSLRLDVDATYTGTSRGGYFLSATQFSLTVPGGTSVVATPTAPGDLVAEPVQAQVTISGKPVAFKVPPPGKGSYALNYKSDAGETAQLPFTIA